MAPTSGDRAWRNLLGGPWPSDWQSTGETKARPCHPIRLIQRQSTGHGFGCGSHVEHRSGDNARQRILTDYCNGSAPRLCPECHGAGHARQVRSERARWTGPTSTSRRRRPRTAPRTQPVGQSQAERPADCALRSSGPKSERDHPSRGCLIYGPTRIRHCVFVNRGEPPLRSGCDNDVDDFLSGIVRLDALIGGGAMGDQADGGPPTNVGKHSL